jgi:hypothetical protein
VVAEGVELGEVVPDLAPGLGVLVVVAGAEVLVAHARLDRSLWQAVSWVLLRATWALSLPMRRAGRR